MSPRGRLGPGLESLAAFDEVLEALGRHEGRADRLAGGRGLVREHVRVLRVVLHVVEVCQPFDRAPEGGMRSDVADALAAQPDLAWAAAQAFDELLTCPDWHVSSLVFHAFFERACITPMPTIHSGMAR